MEQELEATYWNGAKNLDALTDMEELQIQKSSDLPNNTLIFRFELHFGYNMELQPNAPKAFSGIKLLFFLLIHLTRDSWYNNIISITIRSAEQTVSY